MTDHPPLMQRRSGIDRTPGLVVLEFGTGWWGILCSRGWEVSSRQECARAFARHASHRMCSDDFSPSRPGEAPHIRVAAAWGAVCCPTVVADLVLAYARNPAASSNLANGHLEGALMVSKQ